jgi:hypothetical protein
MEEVFIHGKMVENMNENILMIKNMDMEHILGLMEENMKENGKMGNNMEEENIFY